METFSKSLQVLFIVFILIYGATLVSGCSKNAKKVAGTYVGNLKINDTLISNHAEIIIEEIENNTISVSSNYFIPYLVEIDKNRYFNSKTYYSIECNENLEIDGHGNMTLMHMQDGDEFIFTGSRN